MQQLYIRMGFDSKKGSFHTNEYLLLRGLTLWWGVWDAPSSLPAHYLNQDGLVGILQNHAKDKKGGYVEFHVSRYGESKTFSFSVKPYDGVYGLTVTERPWSSVPETPSLGDFEEPASVEDADTTPLLGGKKKRRRGLRGLTFHRK